MKGNTNYFGDDRLSYILLNVDKGHAKRDQDAADERINAYGMQKFSRVHSTEDMRRIMPQLFGQFGYGYVVIDPKGRLRGSGLHAPEVASLLSEIFLEPKGTPGEEPVVTCKIEDRKGGRKGLFDVSKTLSLDLTATLIVELDLPDGYHVYGSGPANPEPTKLTMEYAAGLETGPPEILNIKGKAEGIQHAEGPVRIAVPVRVPKGTAIGEYPLHGKLRFMACNKDHCLPPMELRWRAVISAM